MNTSPITTWEGAEAYFTFGPNSLGIYVTLALAVVLFVGFIVRMIVHENHNFSRTRELHARIGEDARASHADSALADHHLHNSNSHGAPTKEAVQERQGAVRGAE